MIIVKGKVNWIDIGKPQPEDVDFLQKRHKFHPIILDEILHSSIRPRVESYDSYLFFTFYIPVFDPETQTSRGGEIDFLVTQEDVITVHYEKMEQLDSFYRKLVNDANYKKEVLGSNTAHAIYYIIENLIRFSKRQIHHIKEDINYISDEVFSNKEEQMLKKISLVKRNLLDYQIILQPQENLLNSLLEESNKFWQDRNIIYLTDLAADYFKLSQELNNYKKIVESLEVTNAQLLNAKINKTMQKFTVLAFLSYPLIFVTGLLSIRPILNFIGENNVWLAVGGSFLIMIVLLVVFKSKKWL